MVNLRGTPKSVYTAKVLAAQNAKQISKLSRQVQLNKGELKCFQLTGTSTILSGNEDSIHLTGISLGSDVNEREARYIHVYGIDIRLYSGSPVMDNYYVLSRSGNAPTGAFHTGKCGFINNASKQEYKELKYLRNFSAEGSSTAIGNGNYISFRKKYKRPISVAYNNAACVKNALYLHMMNNGTTSHIVTYNVRVWFRDH